MRPVNSKPLSRGGLSRALLALAALLGALSLSAPGAAATANLDRYNGTLVLVRGSQTELWTVSPDGTNLTLVRSGLWAVSNPTVSPDGSKVAFAADPTPSLDRDESQIFVMNMDGSGLVNVSGTDSYDTDPDWSPDGSVIAFSRRPGFYDVPNVWAMSPTGSNQRLLSQDPGTEPAWSPDGSQIAFVYDDLYLMNSDGTNVRLLTDGFETAKAGPTDPSFTPDGSRILFAADFTLHIVNTDGSALTGYAAPGFSHVDARFSPEGNHVAWADGRATIYDPATGETRTIASGTTGLDWRSTPVKRLAGADRVLTAVAASKDQFPRHSAGAAVLVRSDKYADALAGTPLAVAKNGPLLLSATGGLSDATTAELQRVLAPGSTVYLLGGTAALSTNVEAQIRNLGFTPRRLAGPDRFATAAVIARDGLNSPRTVFIATGMSHAEALVAGVAATHVGGAVLLTADDTMPPATKAYLDTATSPTVYAVGSARGTYPSEAIPGSTPAASAVALAERFFSRPARVAIASSATFPDAMSGGAHAGHQGVPLLLVNDTATQTNTYIAKTAPMGAFMYGGTAAISSVLERSVEATLRQ